MKYEDFELNYNYDDEDDNIDLYSSSSKKKFTQKYEDISSNSKRHLSNTGKRKRSKVRTLRNALIIVICVLIAAIGALYGYAYKILSGMDRTPLDENNLGIETSNYDGVQNIALLGIDSRADNDSGRSDAIVILTIDKKLKKLKLTSIARDTYVSIDGHSKDKLTHAYAYGKSQLTVKTLNQNFGLEIEDYVTMNFYGLARVIDYIGGVTIDVDEKEMVEMNHVIIPEMQKLGFDCPNITSAGTQLLNGAQAVCYARIRHTDSDVMRGNRQKEVLTAMFTAVKKMNPLKLPKVAEMVISECTTSFTANDIIGLGTWALAFSPEIEQISIPNENIPSSGKTIKGVWYYAYNLDSAKSEIHDFIYEENYYSAESVAQRAEAENKP